MSTIEWPLLSHFCETEKVSNMIAAGRISNLQLLQLRNSTWRKITLSRQFASTQLHDDAVSVQSSESPVLSTNTFYFNGNKNKSEKRSPKAEINIFSILQTRYHPSVSRAYVQSHQYINHTKSDNNASTQSQISKPLKMLLRWSDALLVALSRKGGKHIQRLMIECYLPSNVDQKRTAGGDLIIGMLPSINTPGKIGDSKLSTSANATGATSLSKKELIVLASTLRVLSPRSSELWVELDRLLCMYVDKDNTTFDPELALLLSHTLISGVRENKLYEIDMLSINKMLSTRLDDLLTHLTNLGRNNVPDAVLVTTVDPVSTVQVISSASPTSADKNNKVVNTTQDNSQDLIKDNYSFLSITDSVFDSLSMEQFGLFTEALSLCTDNKVKSTSSLNTIFNRLYIIVLSIISKTNTKIDQTIKKRGKEAVNVTPSTSKSADQPLKFSCLVHIAKTLAKLKLPNSTHYDLLNKAVYEHMLISVRSDPYQLVNEELKVVETFESMIASGSTHHNELILVICDFYRDKGLDISRIGSRLFNALSELEAFSFALYMLDLIIESSSSRPDTLFVPITFASGKISVMAKTRIFHYLKGMKLTAGHPNALANLRLSLYCFNSDVKNKIYRRFLDEQESVVHKNLSSYSISQLLKLHQSYAAVGRRHPDLCRELDQIFSNNYHVFSDYQVSVLLWSNARLNINTTYNRLIGKSYIANVLESPSISYHATDEVARTIWSMAVLQILQPEEFLMVEPLLLSSSLLHSAARSETHPYQITRMKQVLVEMRLCLFTRRHNTNRSIPDSADRSELVEHKSSPKHQGGVGVRGDVLDPVVDARQPLKSDLASELQDIRSNVSRHPSHQHQPEASTSVATDESSKQDKDKIADLYSKVMATRHWENLRSVPSPVSSFSHKEISKVLTFMGIKFEMEKTLEFGLVVDIFVPPSQAALLAYQQYEAQINNSIAGTTSVSDDVTANGTKTDRGHKGIALEVDGPFHFESYFMVSYK